MKSPMEIYREEKKKAEGEKSLNITKNVKESLKKEINEDKDLLLTYKIDSTFLSSFELASFVISVVSFFIAIASLSKPAEGFDPFLLVLIVGVLIFALVEIKYVYPSKKISMILEEIEKEMDKKEKDEERKQN